MADGQQIDYRWLGKNFNAVSEQINQVRGDLSVIDSDVGQVNENVKVVYDSIETLANEFKDFLTTYEQTTNVQEANDKLVQIRMELDKKYGHYDMVRRTATGILQADDLGIVKKTTITDASENLMITTPGYWLAPCLVALAAWINDKHELSDKALKEAIKRNDEKTSLFFALICRRANRLSASLLWTRRYLENQDEENLDRKTIIVLDAYASGLLGPDSEGTVSKKIGVWMEHLSAKPGFVENQTEQWSNAINAKKKEIQSEKFTYLQKYSKSWPLLKEIMEGAMLHEEILNYFTEIFNKESSSSSLKAQLDEMLTSLVSDFDEEEIPLKKEEKYYQFVLDYNGDKRRAKRSMEVEQTAFEEHKDFTQLLTDAAMKPESSHAGASTQKFAISLAKEWIVNSYNDITAKNRMKIPDKIEINIDTFNDSTADGGNEAELTQKFKTLVHNEKKKELSLVQLSAFAEFSLFGGGAIALLGLIIAIAGLVLNVENSSFGFGIIALISGVGLIFYYLSKKKEIKSRRKQIIDKYSQKETSGLQILRATLAEVVDFKEEFSAKDAESQDVLNFLEGITPDQYVKKLHDTSRKIKIDTKGV